MKWNVYINHRGAKGTTKHVAEVPGTTRADGRAVTIYAARHFKVSQAAVLAIPQPASETHIDTKLTLGDTTRTRSRTRR